MIRRYENCIINLTKVTNIILDKNYILFKIQSNESFFGTALFFSGGNNIEKFKFKTEEDALKEFNDINSSMNTYYKQDN